MNQFDFWMIMASCDRKGPLKKAGFRPDQIYRKLAGYKVYGRNRYPRYRYEAAAGFVDAPLGRDAINAAEASVRERFSGSGVSISVKYVCRD
jgi:hypothetical protein